MKQFPVDDCVDRRGQTVLRDPMLVNEVFIFEGTCSSLFNRKVKEIVLQIPSRRSGKWGLSCCESFQIVGTVDRSAPTSNIRWQQFTYKLSSGTPVKSNGLEVQLYNTSYQPTIPSSSSSSSSSSLSSSPTILSTIKFPLLPIRSLKLPVFSKSYTSRGIGDTSWNLYTCS